MNELDIKYEMTFTCDERLIMYINYEWGYALGEIEEARTEEEIFDIALEYALIDHYDVGGNEREVILAQSNKIYKWWKENKKYV